jgi:para-nitrobenzyl esterase
MSPVQPSQRKAVSIRHFPAIRYAEPPVRNLRFAAPRRVKFDESVLHSTAASQGPVALQTASRLSRVMGDFTLAQSEDCLNLALWTPGLDNKSRPVLFWMHGGGFSSGGGGLDWYNGHTLAAEGNVVVVSPNYRLGALGFLCHPELGAGNQGILDLEAALQWTRENIHHFGGDPDRITVMGQSAGAWSATLMLGRMAKVNPPIHQVILQSGALIPPLSVDVALQAAEVFLEALPRQDLKAGERAKQATDVQVLIAQNAAVQHIAQHSSSTDFNHPAFAPVGHGQDMPLPQDYFSYLAKAAARVPVMVGWTRDEMNAFGTDQADEQAQKISAQITLKNFTMPSKQWALHAQQAGKAAYAFSFDWAPQAGSLGACHTIELPFVFGTLDAFQTAPMLRFADHLQMQHLSRQVRAAWLAFIQTGSPNVGDARGLPDWPTFDERTGSVMHIDETSRVISNPLQSV